MDFEGWKGYEEIQWANISDTGNQLTLEMEEFCIPNHAGCVAMNQISMHSTFLTEYLNGTRGEKTQHRTSPRVKNSVDHV